MSSHMWVVFGLIMIMLSSIGLSLNQIAYSTDRIADALEQRNDVEVAP